MPPPGKNPSDNHDCKSRRFLRNCPGACRLLPRSGSNQTVTTRRFADRAVMFLQTSRKHQPSFSNKRNNRISWSTRSSVRKFGNRPQNIAVHSHIQLIYFFQAWWCSDDSGKLPDEDGSGVGREVVADVFVKKFPVEIFMFQHDCGHSRSSLLAWKGQITMAIARAACSSSPRQSTKNDL